MLAAQRDREFAPRRHASAQPGKLAQRRLDRTRDRGLAHGRDAPRAIGLTFELVVVGLQLLARLHDRRRPGRGTAAVAHGGLEAEGYDDSPRRARVVGVGAHGIEEALLGRRIVEGRGHAWTCCASRRLSLRSLCSTSAGYIVSIGWSSRMASSKAP